MNGIRCLFCLGGKCFSYENSEKSRQQQDRAQAKSDLLIGELEEGEEFRDPWMEPDKPKKGKGKGKRQEDAAPSGDPTDTVAAAAQDCCQNAGDAAKLQPLPASQDKSLTSH